MSVRKVILIVMSIVMLASVAEAQRADLKRAGKMMKNLEYKEAIRIYNKVLEKRDNAEAKINIAEAYRKIDDAENAEYWYGQVVILPEAQPIHQLY
ncbi:MAG TPA: flagellar motor protein MotB, partial [Saprospiraceae bacterium]|nr:flagellar motor protein MotB [Saprospiraceae bacterium]